MKELLDVINANCRPFLNALKLCPKGSLLCRGFFHEIKFYREFEHSVYDRKPLNTPQETHDLLNSTFEPLFGWKIRNGIFCYGFNGLGGAPHRLGYGTQYIFFPKGQFDFAYNPDIFDFYEFALENRVDQEVAKKLNYRNDSLCKAIDTGDKSNGVSNEISFKAANYYLVNSNYSEGLISFIWKC